VATLFTPHYRHLLAMDTSTERLSLALAVADGSPDVARWAISTFEGDSGAKASAGMLDAIAGLVRDAGLTLRDLDAIVFGQGPGAFTGLRTACAVAQGLAMSVRPGGIPVIPVNSLLATAQAARMQQQTVRPEPWVACLDARMGEIYVARYAFGDVVTPTTMPIELQPPCLLTPRALVDWLDTQGDGHMGAAVRIAGNALTVYRDTLADHPACANWEAALPSARALLHLAPSVWQAGQAVTAADARPLYVRDKVAQTTAERLVTKAANAGL